MAANTESSGRLDRNWRMAIWGLAAIVLALPLVAMQITDEVDWGLADFAIFAAMLAATLGTWELAARMTRDRAYRAATALALAAAFILVWMTLAVGIIGSEDNPANLMYAGVLAIGLGGAVVARGQPHGMARASFGAVVALAVVAALVLIIGEPPAETHSAGEILGLHGIFGALFLASACLFRKAAHVQAPAGAARYPAP